MARNRPRRRRPLEGVERIHRYKQTWPPVQVNAVALRAVTTTSGLMGLLWRASVVTQAAMSRQYLRNSRRIIFLMAIRGNRAGCSQAARRSQYHYVGKSLTAKFGPNDHASDQRSRQATTYGPVCWSCSYRSNGSAASWSSIAGRGHGRAGSRLAVGAAVAADADESQQLRDLCREVGAACVQKCSVVNSGHSLMVDSPVPFRSLTVVKCVRKKRPAEVAKLTGRTFRAVLSRRHVLGIT